MPITCSAGGQHVKITPSFDYFNASGPGGERWPSRLKASYFREFDYAAYARRRISFDAFALIASKRINMIFRDAVVKYSA